MTADEYFAPANHVASSIWSKFISTMRTAAIAQATRQIELVIGDTALPEPNCSYAIFEQALHVLKTSGVALDSDNNRPDFIPPDGEAKSGEPVGSPNEVCAAALAWIHGLAADGTRVRPVLTLVRG